MLPRLRERIDRSGFDARLGSINSLVTVGGFAESKEDFRPEAHMIAHDGEVFINVRKPSLNRVDKPLLIDGRAEAICDGLLESFRVTPEGEIEWDTVYPSLPDSPEIVKEITDSGNVSYSKQILNPEQIRNGHSYNRPENEGCIVAYIDGKRNNKYQTGKVFQCTRSILYDAKGNTAYTDINIYPDGRGKWFLVETLPYEWMKRATYPILKDPILGYSTKGSIGGGLQNLLWFQRGALSLTDATGGVVVKFSCYPVGTGVTGGFCVYECPQTSPYDPAGHTLINEAEISGTVAGVQFDAFPVTGGLLSANTFYRVGIQIAALFFDIGTSYQTHRTNKQYPFDNPMGATGSLNSAALLSLWLTYEAPVGAKIPPHLFGRVL